MKLQDIKNQWVKVGLTSITVKNKDTGKTRGVVRGICKFQDLQPNRQIDYFKLVCDAGLWGNGESENVIFYDGNLYYLDNLNLYQDVIRKYEPEKIAAREAFVEGVAKYITVIPVIR